MSARCAYCTKIIGSRVYLHEKGKHPEPRPKFCSYACVGHYDRRRLAESRAFYSLHILGIFTQLGILSGAITGVLT